ncbi:MAG: DDE-type integrase/transposase/recombinase [Candidatus Thiodiazotropha sp.]
MQVVCIDYLSLERSKGGYENILVITDHFTRFAQAIPTKNQTAHTTARVLYDNFFIHYGFPEKLHSDQGADFESKLIKNLCSLTGIKKSRTTRYHPMGNGMVERFNKTLLNMLGTLQESQKSNWKEYVTLTHAYNAASHDSTDFSPFFLMFGRHPRLAVDAFLGIPQNEVKGETHKNFVDKLQQRLATAYKAATTEALKSAERQKQHYDQKVQYAKLEAGDRVLVRNVSLRGKQKLADQWEEHTYIVKRQPIPEIPVYEVIKENSSGRKCRTLHRNMLLPYTGPPSIDNAPVARPMNDRNRKEEVSDSDVTIHSDSSSDYDSNTETSPKRRAELRRSQRIRRQPQRLQYQHTFTVPADQVIYI